MKIKPLKWIQSGDYYWMAQTPSVRSGYISISFEEERYWPNWSSELPCCYTLEEAQALAQEHHEAFIMKFLEC